MYNRGFEYFGTLYFFSGSFYATELDDILLVQLFFCLWKTSSIFTQPFFGLLDASSTFHQQNWIFFSIDQADIRWIFFMDKAGTTFFVSRNPAQYSIWVTEHFFYRSSWYGFFIYVKPALFLINRFLWYKFYEMNKDGSKFSWASFKLVKCLLKCIQNTLIYRIFVVLNEFNISSKEFKLG